jgi:glucose-6-phosphate isomerase
VGLLPAALVGIDIDGLLDGARVALERAEIDDLQQNPAALYAALHHEADQNQGARIQVLMPYSDRLRELAEWYRQLWAESLGKRVDREGRTVHVGPTPVGAVGATDQHSQVQLFMEGPYDKTITFITIQNFGVDLKIPGPPPGSASGLPADLAYLPGHTLAELLQAEYEATASALAQMGRMSCALRFPDLTASTLGEALMFFQLATGYAGVWYGIDPFDQPGVELGKRLTFAAMGRPGYPPDTRQPTSARDEV